MEPSHTLFIMLPLVGCALAAFLALYAWRRRPAPGSGSFAILMLAIAEWALVASMVNLTSDVPTKLTLEKLKYPVVVVIPVAWLAFALAYTGRERWLTWPRVVLAAIVPTGGLLIAWKNEYLQELLTFVRPLSIGPITRINEGYGPIFWLLVVYSYVLLAIGAILLLRAMERSPGLYRGQIATVLVGVAVPWAAHVSDISGWRPVVDADLTPLAFCLTGLLLVGSLWRFKLLDVAPIARAEVLDDLDAGVIVLDKRGRIVDINSAAQTHTGTTAAKVIGQTADQALSHWPELVSRCLGEPDACAETALQRDSRSRYYEVRIKPLQDRQGRPVGRLIALHDITERKLVEQALKASEQYAKSIVDSSLDMIISTDRERRIVEFNQAAQAAFGYTRAEVVGQSVQVLYADHDEGDLVHRTVFAERKLVRQVRNRRKNGETFTSCLSASVLTSPTGELLGTVGVSRDITEQKHLDDLLHCRLEQLSVLHTLATVSVEARDEGTLIDKCTQIVGERLYPDNFGILLIDEREHCLRFHPSYRGPKSLTIPLGEGLIGQVAEDGRPRRSGNTDCEPGYIALDPQVRSMLCVPLQVAGGILGVINVESTQSDMFTAADEQLVTSIAGQLAAAIDHLRGEAELKRLAATDALTGTLNRRYFYELAARELARSRRTGRPLCAIMLDIDHFKEVNDTFGHLAGDQVLCALTQSCLRQIRETDLMGRYGGEEFSILLPDSDLTNALQVAERIREAISEKSVSTSRGRVRITISMGVVQATRDLPNIATLFDQADAAMYLAKAAGRNRVTSGA